jgi:Fic family protein
MFLFLPLFSSPSYPTDRMDFRLERDDLVQPLDALEERRRLFSHLPVDPTHADWLRRRAWVRTIHGTTRIEGNTLSDIEVDELLSGSTGRNLPRREALEVLGTRKALALVDDIAPRAGVPLDEGLIREVHRRVLDGQSPLLTPGEYRNGENRVGGAPGEIVFTTPPSGDVPELMRALSGWLIGHASSESPPVAAALAHLEFVAIHPFNDGNGRTARAISRLLLLRGDYGLDGLVSLDAYLDGDRRDYFAAIRASIGASYAPPYDATPFVNYFIRSIIRAADHVLERISGLGTVMIAIRREVVGGTLPPAMLDGLAYAWVNRSIRPADYRRLTGRSAAAASRDLASAAKAGYLVVSGQTRARVFLLGERLLAVPAQGESTTSA